MPLAAHAASSDGEAGIHAEGEGASDLKVFFENGTETHVALGGSSEHLCSAVRARVDAD